jgi:hypothetical protein
VNCPRCGRDFVPVEGQRFCSWCGASLETPGAVSQEERPAQEVAGVGHAPFAASEGIRSSRAEYCPWEDQEHLGFLQGIFQTVRQSLFSPKDFFSELPRHGGLLNPLLYALLVGTVGSMVAYLWNIAGISFGSTMSLSKVAIVGLAFLLPLLVFMGLVIGTALLHVSLFLVGGANEDFEATFRVVCYSTSADLFSVFPFIGGVIGLIWKIYITVIGVREVHGISTGRSALALSLPSLVCCGLVLGAIALVILVAGSSLSRT